MATIETIDQQEVILVDIEQGSVLILAHIGHSVETRVDGGTRVPHWRYAPISREPEGLSFFTALAPLVP